MPIKVNISISAGGRFKPVSSHTLHDKRITIGRDKECTVTLEDTQKHVSRTHAELEESEGAYWLKVVSKVNPVIVNGKRLMFGERAVLADGDHISIGLYKLEIAEARVPPPPPARVEPPKHAVERPEDITYVARRSDFPTRTTLPPAGLADIADDNPEATFIPPPKPAAKVPPPPKAPPLAPTPAPPEATDAEEATYVPPVKVTAPPPPPPPAAAAVKTTLPDSAFADDEVTYIPPMWAKPPSALSTPAESPGTDNNSEEDMTNFRRPLAEKPEPQKAAEPPAEVDFDLSDAFAEEETSVRVAPAPAPPPAPAPKVEEVEAGFSEDQTYVRSPGPLTSPPPTPAPEPAVPAYTDAERLAEEETHYRSPVPEIGPRVAPAAAATGNDRAVQAFLEGAGLADLTVADTESFMRNSGVMVRAAVEGVMMLLLARAEARKELGAEPDEAAGDNPLTSMANPAEVIDFLFDPRRPAIGDTDPVLALSDACADLRAHQVALIAGMRAAVTTALLRIDPKKIEREHGINLGGLNLTRKSKLWDISVQQHEQLAREMEDNFSSVFNREILAAYTAQVRKVRGSR